MNLSVLHFLTHSGRHPLSGVNFFYVVQKLNNLALQNDIQYKILILVSDPYFTIFQIKCPVLLKKTGFGMNIKI